MIIYPNTNSTMNAISMTNIQCNACHRFASISASAAMALSSSYSMNLLSSTFDAVDAVVVVVVVVALTDGAGIDVVVVLVVALEIGS